MPSAEPRIRCPKCSYRPTVNDRWRCVPSCDTEFHTFWTGGVCPGCAWKWEKTQCPSCGVLSPHLRWYHWPDRPPAEAQGRERSATSP